MRTLPHRFELHVPSKTILKVLVWALVAWMLVKLWPELVYLTLSVLLAVALGPAVERMGRWGIARGTGVALIAGVLLTVTALLITFVVPPLFTQGGDVAANFPAFRERVQQHLPAKRARAQHGVPAAAATHQA